MKKLILVAVLLFGITNYAQGKKSDNKKSEMEQMTPEQRNDLMLKKMTLELDLNANQQKEMSVVLNETSAKRAAMKSSREKGEQLTSDQKYEMKAKMLDEQTAMKSRVQKILTPSQYEKWEQMKQNKKKESKYSKTRKIKVKEE